MKETQKQKIGNNESVWHEDDIPEASSKNGYTVSMTWEV